MYPILQFSANTPVPKPQPLARKAVAPKPVAPPAARPAETPAPAVAPAKPKPISTAGQKNAPTGFTIHKPNEADQPAPLPVTPPSPTPTRIIKAKDKNASCPLPIKPPQEEIEDFSLPVIDVNHKFRVC